MRIFRPLIALGCVALSGAMAAEPAQAQSGLFYFVPTGTNVSTFTTNSGGTPTSTGTIGGGGATNAFMSLVRGDQAFAYQTYGGGASDSLQVINTATGSVVQTVAMTQDPQGMAINPNGSTLYVANNLGRRQHRLRLLRQRDHRPADADRDDQRRHAPPRPCRQS